MKPLFKVGEQAVFKTGDQTRGQKAIHATINKKLRLFWECYICYLHLSIENTSGKWTSSFTYYRCTNRFSNG